MSGSRQNVREWLPPLSEYDHTLHTDSEQQAPHPLVTSQFWSKSLFAQWLFNLVCLKVQALLSIHTRGWGAGSRELVRGSGSTRPSTLHLVLWSSELFLFSRPRWVTFVLLVQSSFLKSVAHCRAPVIPACLSFSSQLRCLIFVRQIVCKNQFLFLSSWVSFTIWVAPGYSPFVVLWPCLLLRAPLSVSAAML